MVAEAQMTTLPDRKESSLKRRDSLKIQESVLKQRLPLWLPMLTSYINKEELSFLGILSEGPKGPPVPYSPIQHGLWQDEMKQPKLYVSLYVSYRGSQVALVVKNLPANAGNPRDTGSIPGSGRSPGEETATHSTTVAWKIPWTEEPGRLHGAPESRTWLSNDAFY